MSKVVTVTIDGISIQVPEGTLLVEAAKQLQREIPVYCYHPKLDPAGLCRMCLVEIEKMPKLQIACNTRVADGMVVHTVTPQVTDARRAVLELLLLNHPLDCPICDKGGECDLQDYVVSYGPGASRLADAKLKKPKAVDLGPTIVLDKERCILCLRCVRFDDEITQEKSLTVVERGAGAMIATASDRPYHSNFSGNVTEICPVGALTSKTYRFKSRPWDLHRTQTTCTQCSVGCAQFIDERHGNVLRTMSNPHDDATSDTWLCDRGRYNVGFLTDDRRITTPLYKVDGQWAQIGWDDAIALWAKALRDAGPQASGVIGGGRLANEEAYLLQALFRAFGTPNLDWRAGRQRQATPGSGGAIAELASAQAIVVIGDSSAQSAPVLDLRIVKAVSRHGALLVRVGSTDHATPVAQHIAASVEEAVQLLPDVERIAFVWDGASPVHGRAAAKAISTLRAAGKKVLCYIPGEQANARGAEALGMHPGLLPGYSRIESPGLDTAGMLRAAVSGKLSALAIFGANPALHYPDAELAANALRSLTFLAVSELFMTQTAEYATLILPAKAAYEKNGTTTNVAGELRPLAAAVSAPGEALADGEMIVKLAQALGVALPSAEQVAERAAAAVQADASGVEFGDSLVCGGTELPGAVGEKSRLRVVVAPNIFAGGGTLAHDVPASGLRAVPRLTLAAGDAARLELEDGDLVDIAGYRGSAADLEVAVGRHVLDGQVVIIGGLPDAPANVMHDDLIEIARIRRRRGALAAGGLGD